MGLSGLIGFIAILCVLIGRVGKVLREQQADAASVPGPMDEDRPERSVRKRAVKPTVEVENMLPDNVEEEPVEVPRRKMEKIDPKKLVIYSEIMKPKFDGD